MNGIEKIIVKRIDQLDKHGYSVKSDLKYVDGQLNSVASALVTQNPLHWPKDWDFEIYKRWMSEPREEQLAIAGAFLAAEIDRLQYHDPSQRNQKLFIGYKIIDGEAEHETHT